MSGPRLAVPLMAVSLALLGVGCADSSPADDRGCADVTVGDTAFTGFLGADPTAGEIPMSTGDPFRFHIAEDNFDACRNISWLTLRDGTSAAVLLFDNGVLLTDPAPVQMAASPTVERHGEDELQIHFGHYAAPGQMVTQEIRVLTFRHSAAGVTLEDPQWYADYTAGRPRLVLDPGT